MSARLAAPTGLEQLLAAKEIVVTCGPGGVGKTTTAAATLADLCRRCRAARRSSW